MLEAIRYFAKSHDFTFAKKSWVSSMGSTHVFSLRRKDLWIDGFNITKDFDHDNVPMVSGEPAPRIEMDPGKFVVGFYAGEATPTPLALAATLEAFIASLGKVPGLVVISDRTEH